MVKVFSVVKVPGNAMLVKRVVKDFDNQDNGENVDHWSIQWSWLVILMMIRKAEKKETSEEDQKAAIERYNNVMKYIIRRWRLFWRFFKQKCHGIYNHSAQVYHQRTAQIWGHKHNRRRHTRSKNTISLVQSSKKG